MSRRNLLYRAHQCSEELYNEVQTLYDKRTETISELNDIVAELHDVHGDVNIAKVVGSSVGIVGGAISVTGLALAPFTLGGSLVLTAVGSGTAALGGLTTTGSAIAEKVITLGKSKKAQAVIDADNEQVEVVKKRFCDFEKVCEEVAKRLENSKETSDSCWAQLKRVWNEFKPLCKVRNIASLAKFFVWNIFKLGKGAVRVVSSAWDVIQVVFLGAERFAAKTSFFAKIAIRLIGSFGYMVMDVLFLGIGLVVDIYTLVKTLIDMSNGSKSEAGLKLAEKVMVLREEQESWYEVFLQNS